MQREFPSVSMINLNNYKKPILKLSLLLCLISMPITSLSSYSDLKVFGDS